MSINIALAGARWLTGAEVLVLPHHLHALYEGAGVLGHHLGGHLRHVEARHLQLGLARPRPHAELLGGQRGGHWQWLLHAINRGNLFFLLHSSTRVLQFCN